MQTCLNEMKEIYSAHHCSLNVRVSNFGALGLYRDLLGFMVHKEDVEYYADGENAYEMIKYFNPEDELKAKKANAKKDHEKV